MAGLAACAKDLDAADALHRSAAAAGSSFFRLGSAAAGAFFGLGFRTAAASLLFLFLLFSKIEQCHDITSVT